MTPDEGHKLERVVWIKLLLISWGFFLMILTGRNNILGTAVAEIWRLKILVDQSFTKL